MDYYVTIKEIEEARECIILLLEILCGERIACYKINARQGENIYEYLGLPWSAKDKLKAFERADKDEYYLVKSKLFTLSDFKNNF